MSNGKVVLFYPTYGEITGQQYHWFPFSYLYLGPFLEKAGFDVEIIDARVEDRWYEKLGVSLRDALCLSVTSMTGPDITAVLKSAALAKSINPALPVIWGGVHATVLPELTVKHEFIDIVVRGMGNLVFPELCRRLATGTNYAELPGLSFKEKGTVCHNHVCDISPYDDDFFPCFHLLDVEKYRSPNNVVSVFSALGCPFNCTFCTQGKKGHINYIERRLDQVKRELTFQLSDLGFAQAFESRFSA